LDLEDEVGDFLFADLALRVVRVRVRIRVRVRVRIRVRDRIRVNVRFLCEFLL